MSDGYLNPKTKKLLKKVAAAEGRTMDGEVYFLLQKKAKEIGVKEEAA